MTATIRLHAPPRAESQAAAAASAVAAAQPRFRLVRYFAVTAAAMFAVVAAALAYYEWAQGRSVRELQSEQAAFFERTQRAFAQAQEETARADLLAVHESGNVNLTRLFANALWERDFAPYVARAQHVPVAHCRAIEDAVDPKDGKARPTPEKKQCFAEAGARMRADPAFAALNAKVYDAMRRSTVFKIKVFDLRGITVYSSEHAQMGEDKSSNAGWRGAAIDGRAKSELTFRDKFSAFEGVVEKRDLISSYLPVFEPGSERIVGVFEVYSDVTPFLAHIKGTTQQILRSQAANRASMEAAADNFRARLDASARTKLATVLGLLITLFAALFVIVRHADRILAQQAREREHAQRQLTQNEKMASLGQMVAGVAHQLNTPLAFSQNNVRMALERLRRLDLPLKVAGKFSHLVKRAPGASVSFDVGRARATLAAIDERELDVVAPIEMLGDTLHGIEQMRELVDHLRDFTRLDRGRTAAHDLNKGLRSVVYIARSVIPTRVRIVEDYAAIPPLQCNASQLNQVFLNLVNNAAQAIDGDGEIRVATRHEGDEIVVEVADTGSGIAPEVLPHVFDDYFTTKPAGEGTGLGLPIARAIAREHGGDITVRTTPGAGSVFTVRLPVAAEAVPA